MSRDSLSSYSPFVLPSSSFTWDDACPSVMSVLRRPDGLFALLSYPRPLFDPRAANRANAGDPYAEILCPLKDVPTSVLPRMGQLIEAWEAIASVSAFDAEVLANVLDVLLFSIADPDADVKDVPWLTLPVSPAPPRATAAHPRAYQGTKYKPPKAAAAAPVDLRAQLCVPNHEARLLTELRPFLHDAVDILVQRGWPREFLVSLDDASLLPYGQVWATDMRQRVLGLPPAFRRCLLRAFVGRPWDEIASMLGLYWSLGLETDEALRRCVARVITAGHPGGGVAWCRLAEGFAHSRRVPFLQLVAETGLVLYELTDETVGLFEKVHALSSEENFQPRMLAALKTVRGGYDPAYLLDGITLSNR